MKITRLHSHIGSGTDPEVWKRVTRMTLDLAAKLPDVAVVNLGGGFKVGRGCRASSRPTWPTSATTSTQELIGVPRARRPRARASRSSRGRILVANAGVVVATCVDVVDTGRDGYLFAKLDTGMTEVTRPSLYGAQHPITVLAEGRDGGRRGLRRAVLRVRRHPDAGARRSRSAGARGASARPRIGDLVVVGGAGAYCAAMSTINYNSYPQAPEVMLEPDGTLRLLRRRQDLEPGLGERGVTPRAPRS